MLVKLTDSVSLLVCEISLLYVNMRSCQIDVFIFFSSRGFGFVTFVDPLAVDKVLQSGDHRVDDKKVSF